MAKQVEQAPEVGPFQEGPKAYGPKDAKDIVNNKTLVKDKQDGKFRKAFVIQALAQAGEEEIDEYDSLHLGNKQSVLQECLNVGLHAKSEPKLESRDVVHVAAAGNSVSIRFVYVIDKVVPSVLDEDPASTVQTIHSQAPFNYR